MKNLFFFPYPPCSQQVKETVNEELYYTSTKMTPDSDTSHEVCKRLFTRNKERKRGKEEGRTDTTTRHHCPNGCQDNGQKNPRPSTIVTGRDHTLYKTTNGADMEIFFYTTSSASSSQPRNSRMRRRRVVCPLLFCTFSSAA